MDMPEDGFLSPLLEAWERYARESAPDFFLLAEDVNRAGLKFLRTIAPSRSSSKELFAACFYARSLQTFEGVLLLARRGMAADARTLVRSIAETTIYLAGVATQEGFLDRLAWDNNKHYFRMGQAVLDLMDRGIGGTAQDADELRTSLRSAKEKGHTSQWINLEELAEDVDMETLYDVVYRQLSGDSAHPSISSVERHIARDTSGQVEGLIFQPQRGGLEETVRTAVIAFLGSLEALAHVYGRNDIQASVDAFTARLLRLPAVPGDTL